MKKTLLAVLAMCLASAVSAQETTGTFERQVEIGVGKFKGAGSRELHPLAVSPFQASPILGADQALIDLIARTMPSVVRVDTDDGLGSGFIIDPSGLVMTNAHVVEKAAVGDELDITLSDKKKLKGKVLAIGDKKRRGKDFALLQLEGEKGAKFPALSFDGGKSAVSGRYVLALGNPKGMNFTTTTGIISAVDRWFDDSVLQFIQTNAAINPGNSGGPLIDMQGKVLGMNTQIVTEGGGSEGLGFAITAQDCVRAVEQYRRTGDLKVAYIGAALLGDEKKPVVTVTAVAGPAKKAGLKIGDRVLEVDGAAVTGEDGDDALRQALRALAFRSPGETFKLAVEREHVKVELEIKAADFPKPVKGVIASLETPAELRALEKSKAS